MSAGTSSRIKRAFTAARVTAVPVEPILQADDLHVRFRQRKAKIAAASPSGRFGLPPGCSVTARCMRLRGP